MSLVTDVIARLESQVPALIKVEGAAELSLLIDKGKLPPRTPAAFVLWLGEDAAPVATVTGVHRQQVTTVIGVVLVESVAGDATGARAYEEAAPLRDAVTDALAGWPPGTGFEPCAYRRGRFVGMPQGKLMIQVDVSTTWQLRK